MEQYAHLVTFPHTNTHTVHLKFWNRLNILVASDNWFTAVAGLMYKKNISCNFCPSCLVLDTRYEFLEVFIRATVSRVSHTTPKQCMYINVYVCKDINLDMCILHVQNHFMEASFWFTCQGRYSQRQSLGSMIPDLIKDDSCPDFQFVWTKWSRWRKLLSHWLLWRASLWFQPIVSDFFHCRKLFMNSTNVQQKILDYLITIISSRSFPHCEYSLSRQGICVVHTGRIPKSKRWMSSLVITIPLPVFYCSWLFYLGQWKFDGMGCGE